MSADRADLIFAALDTFRIELPSWGFANTGTRFGKYVQPAAATTLEEKFSDAAEVHALTGACPTLALHVRWDLPAGVDSAAAVGALAQRFRIAAGSINPNLFEEQHYKFGSFGNPDAAVRERARAHAFESVEIGRRLGSRVGVESCPRPMAGLKACPTVAPGTPGQRLRCGSRSSTRRRAGLSRGSIDRSAC